VQQHTLFVQGSELHDRPLLLDISNAGRVAALSGSDVVGSKNDSRTWPTGHVSNLEQPIPDTLDDSCSFRRGCSRDDSTDSSSAMVPPCRCKKSATCVCPIAIAQCIGVCKLYFQKSVL
jgi:hypothetical protein